MKEKQLHILLLSSLFPHAGEPTLGIFVENRLRHLRADENVKAFVVAPVPWFPFKGRIFGSYGRSAAAPTIETRHGVEIFHPRFLVIPKIGMLLTPLFLSFSVKRLLTKLVRKGYRFDLIDAHYLYPDGVAAAALAKAFSVPFFMTARGSDVTQIGLLKRPAKRIVEACKEASKVITVSANLKNDLVQMGVSPSKLEVLRNGVELDRFTETDREKTREALSLKGPVMLFAGWLIPRKRLDLVLGVTALLPDITTIIVGDGPLRDELKSKVETLGIASRVRFLGQKKPEEMPAYYSAADVLLLPSDREGWANVLLEAMACGTPVVTRLVGSAPDLVTDSKVGKVVDSDDSALLAKAVSDILAEGKDRRYVRLFAEKYDWSATSRGQYRLFSRAVEEMHDKKGLGV